MIVGSDRVDQFKEFVPKYNGKDYKFDSVKIISAGERDPDSEGVEGMSASKMRKFAVDKDFENFKTGVINKADAKKSKSWNGSIRSQNNYDKKNHGC